MISRVAENNPSSSLQQSPSRYRCHPVAIMVSPSLIKKRISALKEATRRPLFEELVKVQQQPNEDDKNGEPSWIQLVQNVLEVYSYMTQEERGQVWRLVAILVLAFLLPLSTGNEATLLTRRHGLLSADVADLELEERLAAVMHHCQVVTNGTLMDARILLGWHEFVHQALVHGLLASAAPPPTDTDDEDQGAADLLHVLALAITPRVNHLELDLPAPYRGNTTLPAVARLYRLAQCPTAAYFYIQDGQREQLVQYLYQHWQTPPFPRDDDDCSSSSSSSSGESFTSLAWTCGVAHLRASLGAWARRHYYGTRHVLALQARLDSSWMRAWNTTLNELVSDDRVDYHTTATANAHGCCSIDKDASSLCWTLQRQGIPLYLRGPRPMPPTTACPHIQRGFVLACLLLESCGQANHDQHMATALTALSDALEWQLDAWTIDERNKNNNKTTSAVAPIACLAAVLLHATSLLFQLVDATATKKNFAEVYENILHSSIQFLRHDNVAIRLGAAKVLEHAWNTLGLSPTPFASVMLTTLQQIKTVGQRCEWKRMLGMLSRSSPAFANQVAKSFLLDKNGEILQDHVLAAVVASNQPGTFDATTLKKALSEASGDQSVSFVAALVASRQSYYFDKTQSMWDSVSMRLGEASPWDRYRIGIFSLINGEYVTAANLFQKLSQTISDKYYYLWMETLFGVARAEGILAKQAALGIPSASTLLHSALAYLDGLQSSQNKQDYSFQIRFLLLRLDILDLMAVLRQTMREMRLTGEFPAKGTRTFSHIPSVFRSFLKLARQFRELDKYYGLLWQSRRTTLCLAALRDLAIFLAQSTRAAFGTIMPAALMKIALPKLSTKLVFPINKLIIELEGLVILPIINAGHGVDSKTISTALLQVLDGILMVPIPIPRDFCFPLPIVELEWSVRPDASHVAEIQQSSFDVVESFPSVSSCVCIEGRISNATKVRRATRSVDLSYHLRHVGPLEEDGGSKDALRLPAMSKSTSIALGRQGEFYASITLPPLHEEGWFSLETHIKCQAVDRSVYDVSTSNATLQGIKIRNARSR